MFDLVYVTKKSNTSKNELLILKIKHLENGVGS